MENKVLAVVNGREITDQELNETIQRIPRERQSFFYSEEGKKQLLDQVISFELLYNYAEDNGIDKDPAFINQLQKARKELLTQAAIDRVLSEISVSDEEAQQYYDQNKDMFNEGETVNAKHILVETLEKANSVKDEISKGLSFENAATEYSSCPSKSQGGSLGSFSRGQMVPEFENAAFSLETGVVSEPVKTQFGYHLIKVESKNAGRKKSFAEVKDNLKTELLQQKQNMKYMEVVYNLKKSYPVEIK